MAAELSKDFTAEGVSAILGVSGGGDAEFTVTGDLVGTIVIERDQGGGLSWQVVAGPFSTPADAVAAAGVIRGRGVSDNYRAHCTAYTSGTGTVRLAVSTEFEWAIYSEQSRLLGSLDDTGVFYAAGGMVVGDDITASDLAVYSNLDVLGTSLFESTVAVDGTFLTSSLSLTQSGVGSKGGVTITSSEQGNSVVHKTVLTFTATPLTVTDALAYASSKIYDFPEGHIMVLGAVGSLQFAVTSARAGTINDNAGLSWGVGSVAASNITLATTMVDIIPITAKTLAAATTAINTASNAVLAAAIRFDGTGTAADAYLNVAFPTNTDIDADGTMTVTGTITITWLNLGDY